MVKAERSSYEHEGLHSDLISGSRGMGDWFKKKAAVSAG